MKKRIITGVIGGIAIVLFVVFGGLPFTLLFGVIASIAFFELLKMREIKPLSSLGIVSLVLLWIIFLPSNTYTEQLFDSFSKTQFFITFIFILLSLSVVSKNKYTFDHIAFSVLSSCYIGFGFHFFTQTRFLDEGIYLIFFILFIIWSTDSGAYFIGKSFGKHKLWPHISPNKTVEGAIGGIVCAFIIGTIFYLFFPFYDSIIRIMLIIFVVSTTGQLGDFVESAIKRHYLVKDSGNILPGHGGFLDRFDSLIFVMPVLYVLQLL
ncbi:MAG: phosphatidate cytidylyltransferase [Bacillaceae bacterium]|nr:phosphatidate cytidylyltransferase [Bacillaceae bacterium]